MKTKAIIFDVDGTLADTEEAHRLSFNKTFEYKTLDYRGQTGRVETRHCHHHLA